MEEEDVANLLNALDNEDNESLLELNPAKIKQQKNDILQRMQFKGQDLKKYHQKLKNYRYVDEVKDLKYGAFIRWFKITDPNNISLVNGAILCDIKIQNDGIHLVFKNFMNRFIQIRMDECILFQKISDQEAIILSVLDYLKN